MKFASFFLTLIFSLFLGPSAFAACTLEVPMTGPIGSGSLDIFERAERRAEKQRCDSILLLINTPGGSVDSTRRIVAAILNSPRPVLCLVYPDGGHAGSAGAIILQACHVNGAMSGTNLGAATPILGNGETASEDLRKKLVNDMTSWMDSLTSLRKRDRKFGRDIIVDAKAVSAAEAFKIGAIDFVVTSKKEFLDKSQQKEVILSEGKSTKVITGEVTTFELDTRFELLSLLSDPQIAYMLFLGSLALLYFELTHPGTMIAGVVGGLGLVLSLVALHKLNVEWGGVTLILIGVALLIAEMFVASFGVLGVGGIAAFVLGSLFLFDPEKTGGYTLPLSTIFISTLIFGVLFLGIGYLIVKTLKIRRRQGVGEMIGVTGRVLRVDAGGRKGFVECRGETWGFDADEELKVLDEIKVVEHQGLRLKVRKQIKGV